MGKDNGDGGVGIVTHNLEADEREGIVAALGGGHRMWVFRCHKCKYMFIASCDYTEKVKKNAEGMKRYWICSCKESANNNVQRNDKRDIKYLSFKKEIVYNDPK
jgi:hypothetical protein